ncbi:MAG: cupin domain-containing protein [Methanobacterium sp.]|nr:cupin domain-containing protein [Methanobacterium sp.]
MKCFFLEGKGIIKGEGVDEIPIGSGDAIFIEPREYHQLKNTGTEISPLIYTVTILTDMEGKNASPCY